MFSQSLIAVFKALAEFNGYVPVQRPIPVQAEAKTSLTESAPAAAESCCAAACC